VNGAPPADSYSTGSNASSAKPRLERQEKEGDDRAWPPRPSATGARLAPRAIAVVERAHAEFFADVPTGEALALLRRLAGSFDGQATATVSARGRRPG
jgi:hypothetical protein